MKDACPTMSFAKLRLELTAEAGHIAHAKVECEWDWTGRIRTLLGGGCCALVAHWALSCRQSTAYMYIQMGKTACVTMLDWGGRYMHVDGKAKCGIGYWMRECFSCIAIPTSHSSGAWGGD